LILEPTTVKRPSFWRPGVAFAIMRDDAAIGRVDISGRRDGEAQITLRERVFDCRMLITGRAHWNYVTSRWVMSSGGIVVHGATWESSKTFLTENEPELQRLWLRRDTFTSFAVVRASDEARVGEIRWEKRPPPAKPFPRRVVLDASLELPETFEVLLLWIVVQDDYRSNSG
jgi:hypothetical protein